MGSRALYNDASRHYAPGEAARFMRYDEGVELVGGNTLGPRVGGVYEVGFDVTWESLLVGGASVTFFRPIAGT